jgi:hypothetical protein
MRAAVSRVRPRPDAAHHLNEVHLELLKPDAHHAEGRGGRLAGGDPLIERSDFKISLLLFLF